MGLQAARTSTHTHIHTHTTPHHPHPQVREHGIQIVIADQMPHASYRPTYAAISYPYRLRHLAEAPYPNGTCFRTALFINAFTNSMAFNPNANTSTCFSPIMLGVHRCARAAGRPGGGGSCAGTRTCCCVRACWRRNGLGEGQGRCGQQPLCRAIARWARPPAVGPRLVVRGPPPYAPPPHARPSPPALTVACWCALPHPEPRPAPPMCPPPHAPRPTPRPTHTHGRLLGTAVPRHGPRAHARARARAVAVWALAGGCARCTRSWTPTTWQRCTSTPRRREASCGAASCGPRGAT